MLEITEFETGKLIKWVLEMLDQILWGLMGIAGSLLWGRVFWMSSTCLNCSVIVFKGTLEHCWGERLHTFPSSVPTLPAHSTVGSAIRCHPRVLWRTGKTAS